MTFHFYRFFSYLDYPMSLGGGRLFSLTSCHHLILMQTLLLTLSFCSCQHSQHKMQFFYDLIPSFPLTHFHSYFPISFHFALTYFSLCSFPYHHMLDMRQPKRTPQLKIVADIICDSWDVVSQITFSHLISISHTDSAPILVSDYPIT